MTPNDWHTLPSGHIGRDLYESLVAIEREAQGIPCDNDGPEHGVRIPPGWSGLQSIVENAHAQGRAVHVGFEDSCEQNLAANRGIPLINVELLTARPTEAIRGRLRLYLGDRFDGARNDGYRSFRRASADLGVPFNTLARFARGEPVRSDTLDAIASALARLASESSIPAICAVRPTGQEWREPCGYPMPCRVHGAGLPVEEGYEQQQRRLRREEEDRL